MVDLQRVAARVAEAKKAAAHEENLAKIAREVEEAKREEQRASVLATAKQLGLDDFMIAVQESSGFKFVVYTPIAEERVHYHGADYDLSYEYALKSLAQLADDEDKLVALFLRERIICDFEVPGNTLTVEIRKATPRKTGMLY